MSKAEDTIWAIIAIALLTVVCILTLETAMEKQDAINRQAAQQCQRMIAESYR